MTTTDNLYENPEKANEPFQFDASVVQVFDDMISRSVPLYDEVQETMVRLALPHLQTDDRVYDLGCSTGATLLRLIPPCPDSPARFTGVDLSQPMLDQCATNLTQAGLRENVDLIQADLTELDLEPCSLVFMNYTLQFLDPDQRLWLLRRIRKALRPGGLLLMTEKVRHSDPEAQETLTQLHHDFKRRNGYSDLEISGKREALMNVLIPLTLEDNRTMLQAAGFERSEVLLKWYTFVSLAAYAS
jgi:tRNA (cmo5U34)-methyltransferase